MRTMKSKEYYLAALPQSFQKDCLLPPINEGRLSVPQLNTTGHSTQNCQTATCATPFETLFTEAEVTSLSNLLSTVLNKST